MGRAVLTALAIVALAPTASWAAKGGPIQQAEKICVKGESAMRAGNVADARRSFEEAVETVPSYPPAHIGLGHIAMTEKRFEDALREYEAAKNGYGDLGEALREIEMRRYRTTQDQIADLRDTLNQLRSAGNRQADASLQIAKVENAIARLEAVAAPVEGAAGKPPGEIYFYIGNALFQLKRRGDAIEQWRVCTEISPKFAMVHNNLALALWQEGKLDEAIASLNRAEGLGFPVNPSFRADLQKARGSAQKNP